MADQLISAVQQWFAAAPPEVQQLMVAHTANVTGTKEAKSDVNYRPADTAGESCSTCAHFDGSSSCAVVAGRIDPNSVSDRYVPADNSNGSDSEAAAE